MVGLERVEFRLAPLALLVQKISIPRINLTKPTASLTRLADGRANWTFDFGPKDEVAPGALLSIGGQRFVVAVATRPFDVHGATVMGVSTDSPLYQAARGLGAGDAFELGGKARTIDSVE